jgi:hypothetical protein
VDIAIEIPPDSEPTDVFLVSYVKGLPVLVRKPLALAFWGSRLHDRAHLTIGDISSVQAFYRGFHERGLPARVLFEGDYPTSGVQTVDPASWDPGSFSAFVFVCGPLHANWSAGDFFGRFSGIPRLALNVSKVHESGGAENLFDLIIWRDSSDVRTFDVAIDPRGRRRSETKSPRRGLSVCLVTDQPEYGAAGATSQAALDLIDEAITISGRERVGDISTVLGTQSSAQIEDAFSSREMVVTTRLHGSLFAIRNGVPIVAIDQVKGGAKVARIIGEELGWPFTRKLEDLTPGRLAGDIRQAVLMSSERLLWYRRKGEALASAATDHMCDAAFAHLESRRS